MSSITKILLLFLNISTFLVSCNSNPQINPNEVHGSWIPGAEPAMYRGANITCANETVLSAADVAQWKTWGINLIRINFNKDDLLSFDSNPPTANDLWAPYTRNKALLETWLAWFDQNQIEVMICLDYLWGDDHNGGAIWSNGGNNQYMNHRLALTKSLADWIKRDWPGVRWLELWNEPHPYDDKYKTWFLGTAIANVRAVNTDITIVCMSPYDWGLVTGLSGWNGVNDPKVAYSTHIYAPQTYTHQGLYGYPLLTEGWPGTHKNYSDSPSSYCDRTAVVDYLAALSTLKNLTGKRVFITEFGVLRWAVGNDKYLADLISVFEEKGYSWLFHSISGWNGWNPSFNAADPQGNQVFGGMHSAAFSVMQNGWKKN